MVQQAQPAIPLLDAVPDVYGHRIDIWVRFAIDQRPPDRAVMDRLSAYYPPLSGEALCRSLCV